MFAVGFSAEPDASLGDEIRQSEVVERPRGRGWGEERPGDLAFRDEAQDCRYTKFR